MDDTKELIYLFLFLIGIVLTAIFIGDQSRRAQAIRDLHHQLEDRIDSISGRSETVSGSVSELYERIEDSIQRFTDDREGIESTSEGVDRVIREADAAIELIRKIRERSPD